VDGETGVSKCWIIDPVASVARVSTATGMIEAADGILRSGDLDMPLAEVPE